MDAEQQGSVWGDYTPTDLAIAKLLAPLKGWKVLDAGEGAVYFTNSREWVSACLAVGEDKQLVEIPLFSRDLNAVADALRGRHVALCIDYQDNSVTLTDFEHGDDLDEFVFFESAGATAEENAGMALEAYLTATKGATDAQ